MAHPQFFEHTMVCSVEGIVFLVKFENEGTPELPQYKIFSYKTPKTRLISEQGTPTRDEQIFDVTLFDYSDLECPICEDKKGSIIKCGTCNDIVCLGASTNLLFNCTNDCGNSLNMKDLQKMKTIAGDEANTGKLLGSSAGTKRLGHTPKTFKS